MQGNHRRTTPQQLWCNLCGGKDHMENSCWHAAKSKRKNDRQMPKNKSYDKYIIPRYRNCPHQSKDYSWKPK